MEKALRSSDCTVTVASLCRELRMSRANWYKGRKVRKRKQVDERLVVKLVRDERKVQHRMGARKLQEVLKPAFEDAGISIGRDRLFEILRDHGLLVPRLPRSCKTRRPR